MKLIEFEELVVVQYILSLDAQGFPPWLAAVKAMAGSLPTARHQDPVGVNWASTFIKCWLKLKVKSNQKHNYR